MSARTVTLVALVTLQVDGELRLPGARFECDEDLAKELVGKEQARPAAGPPATDPDLSEEAQKFAQMLARDAIGYLAHVTSLELLSEFARAERTREGGPRKSVLQAIEEHGNVLTANGAGSGGEGGDGDKPPAE